MKFAHIDFVKNNDEIPLRYIKKTNSNAPLEWYIKTYNPFSSSGVVIANEDGYFVKIPITAAEAQKNSEKAKTLIENAICALKDYNVEIILPPDNIDFIIKNFEPLNNKIKENINVADGTMIWPFFLPQSIRIALKKLNKHPAKCEILVIGGRKSLTSNILHNISSDVNFLTVMDAQNDLNIYRSIAENIFAESGLSIKLSEFNKQLAKNADIVINASDGKSLPFLDYAYKQEAILFDLAGTKADKQERRKKRNDLKIVDFVTINVFGEYMPILFFELVFFLKCKEYRELCSLGYEFGTANTVKLCLNQMKASVSSLHFL